MKFYIFTFVRTIKFPCTRVLKILYYQDMKIGNVVIQGQAVLAPLSGMADGPFRQICRSLGASLIFTEMVCADGIVRHNTKTIRYLLFNEIERPIGIQIFGDNSDTIEQAARVVQNFRPDLIDLNCGCPVAKVVKRGAGSALLRDMEKLGTIVRRLVKSVTIPVTVKIRSGWNEKEIVARDVAILLEEQGIAAITVHPRTRSQEFSGKSDWKIIREVKQAVKVPVIGNGDIKTPEDAKRMLDETGCDLIMVGRGCFGRPWIFREIQAYLDTGELLSPPSYEERITICLHHLNLSVKEKGEYLGTIRMRKHISWYTLGMPGCARLRADIMQIRTPDEMRQRLQLYLHDLMNSENPVLQDVS